MSVVQPNFAIERSRDTREFCVTYEFSRQSLQARVQLVIAWDGKTTRGKFASHFAERDRWLRA